MSDTNMTVELENPSGDPFLSITGPSADNLLGRTREFWTTVDPHTFEISGITLLDDNGGFWVDWEFMEDHPEVKSYVRDIEMFVEGLRALHNLGSSSKESVSL